MPKLTHAELTHQVAAMLEDGGDYDELYDLLEEVAAYLSSQPVTTDTPCADLDAIRAKAETFFEWPDGRRDVVTFTSCLLFARQCIVDTAAENIRLRQAIEKTIADNLHLADGEVCTLIDLKLAVNWDDREWPAC